MNLTRFPLLSRFLLSESDAALRASERKLRETPADIPALKTHAHLLRRMGRNAEADLHLLHVLGHERKAHWDRSHDAEQREQEAREKVSRARNQGWARHDAVREAITGLGAARKIHNKARKVLADKTDEWNELAQRVHAAGGNPGLADHRPSKKSPLEHRERLARGAAQRNGVTLSPNDDSPEGHHFYTFGYSADERRRRVERAGAEHAAAMNAHHPETKAEADPVHSDALSGGGDYRHSRLVRWSDPSDTSRQPPRVTSP